MTDDFVNNLRLEIKQDTKSSTQNQGQIISHKFMLTIDVYPNGKIYPKMFPIGQARKAMSSKKPKTKTKMKEVQVNEEEVY